MKPALEEFQIYEPRLADLVPDDGRLLMHLQSNLQKTTEFIKSLPENKLMYRYADGKWTIKEVINHLIEMERIYMYRALCFARNDQTVLPSFDAEHYVFFSNANERSISDLLGELAAIRQSTITFLLGLTEDTLLRSGSFGSEIVSVRALAYHIAGHEIHHMNIVRERYL